MNISYNVPSLGLKLEVESHEYVLHVDVRSNAFPIWLAADTFPTDGGVGVDLPGLRYGMFNISMNIL